jgi:Ca2+-binding RTX toxin-like protein
MTAKITEMFERLENRQLLASTAVLTSGVLTVTGTSVNDNVYITAAAGNKVSVYDNYVLLKQFDKASIKKIVANMNAGNDYAYISLLDTNIHATLNGGDGNDGLTAGAASATLIGGNGDDVLSGAGGNDSIDGGAGNDKIGGANGNDSLIGGTGNDLITGGVGNDWMDGGLGSDTFRGGAGNDTVSYATRTVGIVVDITAAPGELGDDGQAGEKDWVEVDMETVIGGSGNDKITGTVYPTTNTTPGLTRNNKLVGNGGNDTLIGLDGNDTLEGGSGNDSLDAGAGNDLVAPGSGTDKLIGGTGTDTADYSGRSEALKLSLDGLANDGATGENDLISADFENLTGGNGADTITGNASANVLKGNAGNDSIKAGAGNDTLFGDTGIDQLFGEAGDDTLYARKTSTSSTVLDNDKLDGGLGTDKAQVDSTDTKASIESLMA